jgi:hypothetical protein
MEPFVPALCMLHATPQKCGVYLHAYSGNRYSRGFSMDDSKTTIVRFADYYQEIGYAGLDALIALRLSSTECPFSRQEASH